VSKHRSSSFPLHFILQAILAATGVLSLLFAAENEFIRAAGHKFAASLADYFSTVFAGVYPPFTLRLRSV
jgi:hypothetical protein